MQGYLKLKDDDEELYEIDFKMVKEDNIETKANKEDERRQITLKTSINNCAKQIEEFLMKVFYFIVIQVKQWLNIITVKQIHTGFILILPFCNIMEKEDYENKKQKQKTDCNSNDKNRIGAFFNKIRQYKQEKRLQKCIPKIKKMMKKYQITSLVLSEDLKQNEQFMQFFSQDIFLHKINVLNGKGMMPYLMKEIVEYITQKQNKRCELEDVYILVNQDTLFYRENIAFLSQYFKTINIVTPCLVSYQKFANQLEEKQEAILTVTNNKKKSLKRAKWIINFDVPTNQMKKYTIYRSAVILYIQENEIYQENGFDGIHICQAGIDVSNEVKQYLKQQHLLKQCDLTVLYESFLEPKTNFARIREKLKQDKVKVVKLYGSKGILEDKEYSKNIA